jgi:hypothetical protein
MTLAGALNFYSCVSTDVGSSVYDSPGYRANYLRSLMSAIEKGQMFVGEIDVRIHSLFESLGMFAGDHIPSWGSRVLYL